MKKYLKFYGPIFLLAFIFYMMIQTPHSRPLGDIIFEKVGIPAWTDGLHLSVIILLFTFTIIATLSGRNTDMNGKRYRFPKLLVFVMSVTCISFLHSIIVDKIMESKDNLHTIVLTSYDNYYTYNSNDGTIENFEFVFELKNYSKDGRRFNFVGFNDYTGFIIFNKQGQLVDFYLNGRESKRFEINHDYYMVTTNGFDMVQKGGGSGTIKAVNLQDDMANIIKVEKINE